MRRIEDPAELDQQNYLITGGTGSFGRTMVKRLLTMRTGRITVFSRDEAKQDQMRQEISDERINYVIGDVRDYARIREAMEGATYVFHAAALKQVPACELWPEEAIKTNVLGADNVMQAAIDASVDVCVMLSTDKAVYPVSAMGKSKAIMESLMLARSQRARNTVLCATRYGNVMDSRGSVIPLFCKLIKNKQPLTITDKRMTRFLMSLDESADLVLHAFNYAVPGDIFIKRVPSCKIVELAAALHIIAGQRYLRLKHQIIGTRPGEKLHELLLSDEESGQTSPFGEYSRISVRAQSDVINRGLEYSSETARKLDGWALIDVLKTLPCVQEIMQ